MAEELWDGRKGIKVDDFGREWYVLACGHRLSVGWYKGQREAGRELPTECLVDGCEQALAITVDGVKEVQDRKEPQ